MNGTPIKPVVAAFFDKRTCSVQYVVSCPDTRRCAVIDPVLDFEPKSGATATYSADAILEHMRSERLGLDWVLDTHPHADHFSAAGYLKDKTGARAATGEKVVEVQRLWKSLYISQTASELMARSGTSSSRMANASASETSPARSCSAQGTLSPRSPMS